MLLSLISLTITSYYLGRLPIYTSKETIPIFLLFTLFIVIKGAENSNLLLQTAVRLENGSFLPLKLVLIIFVLSMIVTIDVALVTILPIVLALKIKQKENLTILITLTAHAAASASDTL